MRIIPSRALFVLPVMIVAAALASCSSSDIVETDTATKSEESVSAQPAADQGSIIESGFGQNGPYVRVVALVQNNSDHGGQTVTVNFNLKDESGTLVASGDQLESFSWPGQELVLGTQISLPNGVTAASMEATLLVEDKGYFKEQDNPGLAAVEGTVTANPSMGSDATFVLNNPTNEPLKDLRVGVICHDASGAVNGGGSGYPTLIPPAGEILFKPTIITQGVAADCYAYPAPGI